MEQIFGVVRQVTVFLLIVTALERFGGNVQYRRYIEFAAGLIVIAIVLSPVLNLFDGKRSFSGWLDSCLAGQEVGQIEQEMESFETGYEEQVMEKYREMIAQDVASLCNGKAEDCTVRFHNRQIESIRVELSSETAADGKEEELVQDIAQRYGIGEDSVWLITSGKN